MGLITSIVLAVLTFFGAVFVKIFADEFKAWVPTIIAGIIATAVRTLPPELRERFSEEWPSHIDQIPGDLGKITGACGFLIAAFQMANAPFGLGKRALDLAVTTVTFISLMPLFMLVALAVKLNSDGPVFVRHVRIGRRGKPFQVLKFRTMRADRARQLTAVGRLLRKSSLDEIPQLFSILAGDMSFVGPRPLSEGDDAKLTDLYKACKPGWTGPWLFGHDIATYTGNWSLGLDAKIILATLGASLRTDNEDGGRHINDLEACLKTGLLVAMFFVGFIVMLVFAGHWRLH
jgi:exopolysaccharide production protein ExoY